MNRKPYVEGDKLITYDNVIQLEANFSERHDCTELTFRNDLDKDMVFKRLNIKNWTQEPEYMVDENGKFVKWKMQNTTLYFIPEVILQNQEKKFYVIYGNDTVGVVFVGPYGSNKYTYTVSD